MLNSPEYLRRTLDRERQELKELIDSCKFKSIPNNSAATVKSELLTIASDAYIHSDQPQERGSFVLKSYSAKFIEKLAQLAKDDRDCPKLTEVSLSIERVFVAAFALQYMP